MSFMKYPQTLCEVVENGLCIGCGLCEALAEGLKMQLTPKGVERPRGQVTEAEQRRILQACPGAIISAYIEEGTTVDEVWGAYHRLVMAWSGEPHVRYQASTGGVLTALGRYALASGRAKFVLHVGTDPQNPLQSTWVISETPDQVLANAGSRYAPAAPLAGLKIALQRDEPFVFIGKPCDAGAVRQFAKVDDKIAQNCIAILVMVCGGASELSKTHDIIAQLGIKPKQVADFRYRGFGNPGQHQATTHDGVTHTISYNDVWEDESGWRLQSRCKICADAIGEAADISASDTWIGGSPTQEDDAGFNGVLIRTRRGAELFEAAVVDGMLTKGQSLTPDNFSQWQPHQVRKKQAVHARLLGLSDAGQVVPQTYGLRTKELSEQLTTERFASEHQGSVQRAERGAFHDECYIEVVS